MAIGNIQPMEDASASARKSRRFLSSSLGIVRRHAFSDPSTRDLRLFDERSGKDSEDQGDDETDRGDEFQSADRDNYGLVASVAQGHRHHDAEVEEHGEGGDEHVDVGATSESRADGGGEHK